MNCPQCGHALLRRDEVSDGRRRCVTCHIDTDGVAVFTDEETWPWVAIVTTMSYADTPQGQQRAAAIKTAAQRKAEFEALYRRPA